MGSDNKPLIIEDVTLMSPGNWNGWNYTSEELSKAFASTDWDDDVNVGIFLDHPQNPNNAAADWIGRIKNPHQLADGTIKGDVEIWDQDTIYKLEVAKANFGVSPRIVGLTKDFENQSTRTVQDYVFNSWSVVAKPAQDTAYLNLNLGFSGLVQQLSKDDAKKLKESTEKEKSEELKHDYKTSNSPKKRQKMKGGKSKKMSEEETKVDNTGESEESNDSEEGSEESTEESESSESSENSEDSQELSDSDVLNIMNEDIDGFNSYATEQRAKNPTISLKELAKRYQTHKKRLSFVEELSEDEATFLLKKLLARIGVNELGDKKKGSSNGESKELSKKIASLEKSIKELANKKVPAPKTTKGATSSTPEKVDFLVGKGPSEGVQELAAMLRGH